MKARIIRLTSAGLLALAVAGPVMAAKDDKKKEAAKPAAAAQAAAEPGVIAIVGEIKVTEDDLMASLPENNQKALQGASQRVQDIERQAVQAIFAKRYVEEKLASSKGLTEDALYSQEIAANREGFPAEFKVQIAQAKSQLYDGKRAILDDLVSKKLEENAAKAKGMTLDAYIKAEIEDKVDPVTPADVDQYYNQNQRQFSGQQKDAVAPQIMDMVKRNRIAQKRNDMRTQLRAGTTVRTFLEVPRIPVSVDDDPMRGPKDAPVHIVLFSDFQCPFCSRIETTLKQVKDRYGDKVAIVFRDYPLAFHQNAEKASEAANCAHKQGKYWEYHDALFANQRELGVPALKKQAETLGLDLTAFNECLDSGQMKAEIDMDLQAGQSYGVSGTPASFINGRLLSGAQPFEGFARVIDDELQMKGIPVPTAQAAPATPPTQVTK